MKYIYFGTPEFAATILEKLVDAGMPPAAVVCNPDKPVGRRMIITPPAVKEVILRRQLLGIDVLQPAELDNAFLEKLKSYDADFYVLAAYGKILPPSLIGIPKGGIIGVHPSLLPKLRGATPIQSAIMEETGGIAGTTLFLMDDKIDHGPILGYAIYNMQSAHTTTELEDILARLSGNLLVKTLPRFYKGEITPEPQNEAEATFTKKFTSDDGYIAPETLKEAMSGSNPETAGTIDKKIKALNPEPGVYTMVDGRRMKLLSSMVQSRKLILREIQFEGKKPMQFLEYRKPLF